VVSPHDKGLQTRPPPSDQGSWRSYLGVLRYSRRAIRLVWETNRALTIGLVVGSIVAGVLPSRIAVVGKELLNSILAVRDSHGAADHDTAYGWLALELGLVVGMAVVSRLLGMMRNLLRQQLGQKINVEILEKALTLELAQFEDSELYDSLTRARREASSRPLSLVSQTFELGQSLITLVTLGVLLAQFNLIALAVLIAAAIPPPARTTPRRSSCSASDRGSSTATRRSSTSCTRATAGSRSSARSGRSASTRSARWPTTACTCGSPSTPCAAA
jgi:hypothetical protein